MKLKTKVFGYKLKKDNQHVSIVVMDMNPKKLSGKTFTLDTGFTVTTGEGSCIDLQNKKIIFNDVKNYAEEQMPLIFDFKVDDMKATIKMLKEVFKETKKLK